uniref:H15 domain-containing protein n=1 Tax=Oryza rufipogon TaxID=4529 RepID=A0A0E0PT05_ORYRU
MATATEEVAAAAAAAGEAPPPPPPAVVEEVKEAVEAPKPEEAPKAEEGEEKKAEGEKEKEKAKKERKPRARKPRSAGPHHPPYFEMIKEAIMALDGNGKAGSSPYAIAKYMGEQHMGVLPANYRKVLAVQLRNFAAKGRLVKGAAWQCDTRIGQADELQKTHCRLDEDGRCVLTAEVLSDLRWLSRLV